MKKIRVLYVEDEPFLGRIVKESLESRDFEVTMISDGGQVMRVFETLRPDICVLDIMLPHRDGYSIAQSIRQTNPAIPIIFVTAKTQTEDVVKGFHAGGNDYLRKPFSVEELIARITNLLQLAKKNAPSPNEELVVGKFGFIPGRYELRSPSGTRKLSNREALLVQVLFEHLNNTVARKEVLMRVWGDDSFFNSRNLDVYITKVREYLREDPSIEIMTIKGVGYRVSVS